MITVIFQIAKNTFRENVREPIFLLILLASLTLTGLVPTMTLFVFREQTKMVVDTAMANLLLGGWVLAVICSSHSIAREIESGTAMLILAKPVERGVFIIGKILGVTGGLLVFCFLNSLAALIAIRVAKDQFWYDTKGLWAFFIGLVLCLAGGGVWNYVKRGSYPMNALICLAIGLPAVTGVIRFIPVDGDFLPYAWHVVPALILVTYAVIAMGVLAAALSTRLQLVSNMLVCGVVFTLGLMSDYLLSLFAETNWLAAALYAAIPNWQLMWMADALASGDGGIPWGYVAWGGLYVLMFACIFVSLAVILFRKREIGDQAGL
ncbi:MAG: ABC transporter permease subunit [Lentisphaeria bacterium]|nr:ABC transporter permease subunit [Lentisphaeria bacterium]